MKVKINKNYFNIKNLKTCNEFEKFTGLMFSAREKANALLFRFKKPTTMAIHSFFVFYPFLAIWLDDKNKILDMKVVKPFNPFVMPKKSFSKLVEIPLNKKYEKIVKKIHHRRVCPKI